MVTDDPRDLLRLGARTVDLATGEVHGRGTLRPTERALLAYLADRPGQPVPIEELQIEVWGYAPNLRSRAVYTAVSRMRPLLEDDPANPRHLLADRSAGYRLEGAVRQRAAPTPPTNTPRPTGPLVGRDEVHRRLVATGPVATLVGPGGVGKTRLAVDVAHALRLPGGAWRCDLADLRPLDVVPAVAAALPGGAPSALAGVTARIAALGPASLVLDAAEGVIPAVTELLDAIVAGAPAARVLVTSRARLGAAWERVVAVEPLAPAEARALLEAQLAQRGAPNDGTDGEREALAAASGGLPLAIEILAAHAALVGVPEALRAIARGVNLPSRRAGAPARHRDLDALLGWDRLPPDRQRALAALACVDGPTGGAAAEATIGGDDALALLTDLVDAGLVQAVPTDGAVRFSLLDPVRQAVRRRAPVCADEVHDRLLPHVLAAARRPPAHPARALALPVTPQLDLGVDVRCACRIAERALARADVDGADRVDCLGAAAWLAAARSLPHLGLGLLDAVPGPEPAPLRLVRGVLARDAGDAEAARTLWASVLEDFEAPPVVRAQAARLLVTALIEAARFDEARRWIGLLDAYARELPDPLGSALAAKAAELSSQVAVIDAGPHEALAAAERAVRLQRSGDDAAAANTLRGYGRRLVAAGRADEALDAFDEARQRALRLPPPERDAVLGLILWEIAWLSREEGRLSEALAAAQALLAVRDRSRDRNLRRDALIVAGQCLLDAGERQDGLRRLRERSALVDVGLVQEIEGALTRCVLTALDRPEDALPALRRLRARLARGARPELQLHPARLEAEILFGLGQLAEVPEALDAVRATGPTVSDAGARLLYAEALLRLGRRAEAAAQARRCLEGPALPLAADRAHGLLALCAAVGADPAACDAAWARVRPASRDGWARVHRGWIDRRRAEAAAGPGSPYVPPLSFALRRALDELDGPSPAWLLG